MIAGIPLETVYLYVLIGCAILAVLLVLFGDVLNIDGPFDPMLLVPWVAFTALFAFLGERFRLGEHLTVLIVGAILALGIVFLLNFYILVPLKNSEATLSISEKEMEGRVAQVITPIPVSGMGEIQFKSVTGSLSRPAALYAPQDTPIPRGAEVLIIEVKERVCYVVPYQSSLII